MAIMAIILAFGDSITYGAWDIKNSGWAALMRAFLDDKQQKDPNLYYLFYNLGISGDTTQGLAKRFDIETEVRQRQDREEEIIFIFAFGANDSTLQKSTNEFRVSKHDFQKNLEDTLDGAAKISKKILILNITPVLEETYNAMSFAKGKERFNIHIEEYNDIIRTIAKSKNTPLVDVYSRYVKAGPEKLFSEDGLHPNEAGHQIIFEAVLPELETLL